LATFSYGDFCAQAFTPRRPAQGDMAVRPEMKLVMNLKGDQLVFPGGA
jgi:hypothetical protein